MSRRLGSGTALVALVMTCGCAAGITLGGDPLDGSVFDDQWAPEVRDLGAPRDVAVDLTDIDATSDVPDATELLDVDDATDVTDDDAEDADVRDIPLSIDMRCSGPCVPGIMRSCGRCGAQRCQDDCQWGACASEGECAASTTRACGTCGTQTCTSTCAWGACAGGGACTPGATRACGNCGTQTCTASCGWGACTGTGPCSPGATQGGGCDACSQQVCGTNCQWGGCGLRPGNTCEYRGGVHNRACSACRCGLQWCLASCVWSTSCTSCCSTCGGCQ